jgi:hypothetical protein
VEEKFKRKLFLSFNILIHFLPALKEDKVKKETTDKIIHLQMQL